MTVPYLNIHFSPYILIHGKKFRKCSWFWSISSSLDDKKIPREFLRELFQNVTSNSRKIFPQDSMWIFSVGLMLFVTLLVWITATSMKKYPVRVWSFFNKENT